MKEIYAYYARCNLVINGQMLELLGKLGQNPFELGLPGYFFKTLGQLLEHIYVSDMNWMKEFLGLNAHGLDLEKEVGSIPEYGKQAFSDLATFAGQRKRLDEFIAGYMDLLEEGDLQKRVSRTMRSGQKVEREVWKALIHFFNHQTHHRGQVSNILDDLKLENNYSNMIFID
jgi:uncharacterized damage-inducible protein DinB